MNWPLVNLETLASDEPRAITDGPFGSNLARQHYTSAGPRVVRLQNIGDGQYIDNPAHISEGHFERLRAHEVLPGDLLLASLGEVLPRACLAPRHLGPAIVKADCIRVRLAASVDAKWVLYSLQRPAVRRWADEQRHGVGRPRLGLGVIRRIPVPLPGIEEQRRIVAILEEHLAQLDDGLASLERVRARCTAYLAASVADEFGQVKAKESSLGDLAEGVKNGIFVSRAKPEPDGVPILRIGALRPLRLDLSDLRYSTQSVEALAAGGALLAPGDVLFTRYNGNPHYVGACAVVPSGVPPLTWPDKLIRVRLRKEAADPRFVAYACTFGSGRRAIEARLKTSAGQVGISGRELRGVTIPVPDLATQRAIAESLASRAEQADRLSGVVDVIGGRAKSLRQTILAAAFSGRLTGRSSDTDVISELAEEPA